ncbi:MAG: membrane protein insertase YidC [Candidatus Eisenbacteria bacterium]|nr:membrane protein insertase YidC [Candidatus Eisenbacteria bacterium]
MSGLESQKPSGIDGRMLIAFALMIVIWLVFNQFIMPRQEEPPPPETETVAVSPSGDQDPREADRGSTAASRSAVADRRGERATERPSAGGEPAGEPAAWGARAEDAERAARGWRLQNRLEAEAREIVLDGELVRATFDPRGARIRSWVLKRYTGPDDGPAEMIPPSGDGALGLILQGPEGPLDLSQTLFSVTERRLPGGDELAGARRELRFVAEGVPYRGAAPSTNDAAGESQSRLRIERIYRFDPRRYDMEMEVIVEGVDNFRRDHWMVFEWDEGLPFLEKQEKLEKRAKGAIALLAEEFVKFDFGGGSFGCGCGGGPASQGGERQYEGMLRWAGVRTKYFAGLLIPEESREATFSAFSDPDRGQVGMRVRLPMSVEGATRRAYTIYAGPVDYRIIKEFNRRVDREITRIVDFGGKLVAPLSKAAHWFLVQVHAVVPNYGVAILILSILLRVAFHPLTVKSLRSQRKMQALKPYLDRINEEYKDNPEEKAKKTLEFQRKHGMNPLGGCLPMLVQMPVFIALYGLLMNAIELRKAPFVLWIQDLASPDRVGEIAGVPIHILPILMAATMLLQQRMTPTDPRQAPMMLLMPVMLLVFFYSLPSGLVLYWTITNVLTIGQQMMMKPVPVVIEEEEISGETARKKKKKKRRK